MQLTITTIPVAPLDTNCYVVKNAVTNEAFVIDPGPGWEPVAASLKGFTLTDILLTHAHFDHIGGVQHLVDATGARTWLHKLEASWLQDPEKNLSALMADLCGPMALTVAPNLIQGDTTLTLLGQEVAAFHTPGHSPGHLVYKWNGVLFSGDLVFQNSVGRTDLPGGSHDILLRSIDRVIGRLPKDVNILPGHGPKTTVGAELKFNPYLQ